MRVRYHGLEIEADEADYFEESQVLTATRVVILHRDAVYRADRFRAGIKGKDEVLRAGLSGVAIELSDGEGSVRSRLESESMTLELPLGD